MKSLLKAAMLGLVLTDSIAGAPGITGPAAAMPVFDASNYAQNVLTAARTLQQINQQIQQLQNEATMLQNMASNLTRIDFPQLDALRKRLREIDRLMGEAGGVDFRIDQLDERLRRLFPENFEQLLGGDQRVMAARDRLDAAMGSLRRTLSVQSRIVENIRGDAEAIGQIVVRSQGAEGGLQAQQATNQLLALTAQQQIQLQSLLAAQFRAESIDQVRRAQSEREGREAVRRFLGDGRAYSPAVNE